MIFNFSEKSCQEPTRNDAEFGLCDDQNGNKAYTDTSDIAKWIAVVKNPRTLAVTFIAVDKCVIKDQDAPGRGRCDAILTTEEHLYFVELKNERTNWLPGAIEQLESTIQFFAAAHNMHDYRHRKAFACNKRHQKFTVIDNATNKAFFTKYGVRLDAQAEIIVL